MGVKVKLSEVVDAMESQSDEARVLLDRTTGEIVLIPDEEFRAAEDGVPLEEYPEWQREAIRTAREVLDREEDFVGLPSKFDIHEHRIMERFCLSVKDMKTSAALLDAIRGAGAFRRFKDAVLRFGIEKDWYRFRDEAFREIALEWCQSNGIGVEEDSVIERG